MTIKKIIILSVIGILGIISLFGFGTIGAGERGVHLHFGAVKEVKGEGLYWVFPITDRVAVMDIKVQKEQSNASAASKDLQTVSSVVAVNYSLDPNSVTKIYQEIGTDYNARIIDPATQESVKAATANFTAEELVTKRDEVREQIKAKLVEKLQGTGIKIESFSIINFDFSQSFNQAIEAKVTAEQNALAAKNKLEQVKYEAEQAVSTAEGKAKALQIEGQAISQNPQVLQGRAIEKWNGVLPTVTGSNIPFINIK